MRSCCAERREPKPATVFCRNERQEIKPPTVFAEMTVRKQNRPRFHQKTEKTANSVDGIIKKTAKTVFRGTPTGGKQRKLCFGAPRRAENSENRVLGHPDGQKLAKTAFPNFGKVKITPKSHFPTLGKPKSPENRVSQLWEKQNHSKTVFPNFGKVKITRKPRFPTLGKCPLPFCTERAGGMWEKPQGVE